MSDVPSADGHAAPSAEEVPVELLRGLAVLAEPPAEEHAAVFEALGLGAVPAVSEYSDLFLFQLYPYASIYLGPEGMMGGEAQARVAGFWRATGAPPPSEPDHLASLLGLYAALADRERGLAGAERVLASRARRALLEEHLAPWVFAYLDRASELAGEAYRAWATLLHRALRAEWERSDGAPTDAHAEASVSDRAAEASLHLREVPALPDPRDEGAAPFLAGLLAPVRSGVILARADLALVAHTLGLGLRAGERRYALEHLLAQDAGPVARALASEARRQEHAHRARAAWLGGSAEFAASRCRRTAELLEALAQETEAGEDAPVFPAGVSEMP